MPKAKPATERPQSAAKPSTKGSEAPVAQAKRRPKHRFAVSHHREDDFDQGLRTYAKYRDLGIAAATGGVARAHVIRLIPPFRSEEVSTPHYHDVDFQMIYVQQGWYKTEFEGEGVHTFEVGSCWIQPSGINMLCLVTLTTVNCWRLFFQPILKQ